MTLYAPEPRLVFNVDAQDIRGLFKSDTVQLPVAFTMIIFQRYVTRVSIPSVVSRIK